MRTSSLRPIGLLVLAAPLTLACCAAFCDLDCGPGVCTTPGTSCQPFYEMGLAPMGDADIGVCLG